MDANDVVFEYGDDAIEEASYHFGVDISEITVKMMDDFISEGEVNGL